MQLGIRCRSSDVEHDSWIQGWSVCPPSPSITQQQPQRHLPLSFSRIMPAKRAPPPAELTTQSQTRMNPGSDPSGCSSAARSCIPISHSRSMPIQITGLFSSCKRRSKNQRWGAVRGVPRGEEQDTEPRRMPLALCPISPWPIFTTLPVGRPSVVTSSNTRACRGKTWVRESPQINLPTLQQRRRMQQNAAGWAVLHAG